MGQCVAIPPPAPVAEPAAAEPAAPPTGAAAASPQAPALPLAATRSAVELLVELQKLQEARVLQYRDFDSSLQALLRGVEHDPSPQSSHVAEYQRQCQVPSRLGAVPCFSKHISTV